MMFFPQKRLSIMAICMALIPLIGCSRQDIKGADCTSPSATIQAVALSHYNAKGIVDQTSLHRRLNNLELDRTSIRHNKLSSVYSQVSADCPDSPASVSDSLDKNVDDGVVIVEFDGGFEYLYFPKDPPSLLELGDLHGYKYIMNASFFDGWTGEAVHAGWLKISGKVYAPIKEDQQLTHVAVLDSQDQLKFYDYRSFKSSSDQNKMEFQTGPLVIDENEITYDYINSSINGNHESERALVAYTEDGNKYFIITTIPMTLGDLANKLLVKPIFRDKKLSAVNLDGGPSVALYVRDDPENNFYADRKLPLLLIVK